MSQHLDTENANKTDPMSWSRDMYALMQEAAQAQDWEKLAVIDTQLRQQLSQHMAALTDQTPQEAAQTARLLQELLQMYGEFLALGERELQVLSAQLQEYHQSQKAQQAYQEAV